ncbi:MAG: VTC domain-containing protein, partial [Muribaculaceae bacterium]|nr:VTC domain-containing protein [Muribaculaceae bacterium]
MSGIRLMNRTDTKFVTTRSRLMQLLELARDQYMVQETGGRRIIPYYTTYFDTADFNMYVTHQNGHANRQKLRVRSYVASNLSFLEVKTKDNHKRTRKKRMEVGDD